MNVVMRHPPRASARLVVPLTTLALAVALPSLGFAQETSDVDEPVVQDSSPGAGAGSQGEEPETGPSPETGVKPLEEGFLLKPEFQAKGKPLQKDRDVPELGGAEDPTTVGDVVLWVPRIVFFPVYLVTDFVVRRPLGYLVENVIEEHHVIPRVMGATTFGDRSGKGFNGGVTPRVRLERRMRPAIGLEVYLRDALVPGNDWTVGADTDFRYNVTVDGGVRQRLKHDRLTLGTHAGFEHAGDNLFTGIGPDIDPNAEVRYAASKFNGGLYTEFLPNVAGVGTRLGSDLSFNQFDCATPADAEASICGDDDLLGSDDDRRLLTGPDGLPGFASGYQLASVDAEVFADTRPFGPRPGTGVRATFFGDWGHGFGDSVDIHLLRHGAELAGFLDLYHDRVVGLRLLGELAHPLGESSIPFTELAMLGGRETMRGFLEGTFRGRSMLAATLDYRYPVWSFIDGTVFYEVGNAFGQYFEGFDPRALRSSFGFGFRTVKSRNLSLDLLFALGTSRFDEPFAVDFARLSFGTNWGF